MENRKIGNVLAVAIPILEKVSRLFFIGKKTRAAIRAVVAILTIVKDGLPPDDVDADTFAVTYGQPKHTGKNLMLMRNELAQFQRELQNDSSRSNAIG